MSDALMLPRHYRFSRDEEIKYRACADDESTSENKRQHVIAHFAAISELPQRQRGDRRYIDATSPSTTRLATPRLISEAGLHHCLNF